ncbi:MAG: hypothetical protein PVF87_06120 [Acidimicrobiia bacterium]|jgi:hypothetical protein
MSERLQVLEDGADSALPGPSARPSWIMALAGFVVGLGLGVLLVQPGGADPQQEPGLTSPELPAVTTTTGPEAEPESAGVAGVIEGFPDAIVAVARTSGSSLDHVLWPVAGEVTVRPMTGGADVALDVASQFIAMSEEVPGSSGLLLSMGRFNEIRAVTTEARSYAWHDRTIGSLSYTADSETGTTLYSVRADLVSVAVAEISSPDAKLIGWGDWGWALQQSPGDIVLLNPEGEFKDTEPGVGLATHPDGWVLVAEGEELKLVSAGGGVRRIGMSPDVGTLRAARFSPDAARVAVAGTRGIGVIDLETEEVSVLAEIVAPSVSWSSDSRFVLVPTASGVAVIDLEDPVAGQVVLRDHWVLAVGVVPLRAS